MRKITGKKNNGITLIALVITIIVLLILAGVTIATLTGENGILTRASDASRESEIASVKEQARLDISNWVAEELENGRKGTINDWEDIKTILDTANPDEENRYYVKVTEEGIETPSGYIVPIEEVYTNNSEGNTSIIGVALNTDKYGQKVANYTVQTSEMTTNVWRLFYQDSNYTYLITDESVGSYIARDEIVPYINGSMVSTVGQNLNSMLLEDETFFTESNTNPNIRATAWLTDTSKWGEYANNEDAEYAIGGPTIELYVASFNATATANGANKINLEVGEYGYTKNTVNGQLQTSYNHGIYNNGTTGCWISSPSSVHYNIEFAMHCNNSNLISATCVATMSIPVRPIVCIPTSVFNSKYLSSLVDE